MTGIQIANTRPTDFAELAAAFLTWPKPAELFEKYRCECDEGAIEVVVARAGDDVAGYGLVVWRSDYPAFAAEQIPEIVDLSVLPAFRGRGAGGLLLAEAERVASTRSDTVGLRVGLYADYGPAQRMYARRGYVPDGRGLSIDGRVIAPGSTIVLDDDPVLALTRVVRRTTR